MTRDFLYPEEVRDLAIRATIQRAVCLTCIDRYSQYCFETCNLWPAERELIKEGN